MVGKEAKKLWIKTRWSSYVIAAYRSEEMMPEVTYRIVLAVRKRLASVIHRYASNKRAKYVGKYLKITWD
jgi:hypothetical protein